MSAGAVGLSEVTRERCGFGVWPGRSHWVTRLVRFRSSRFHRRSEMMDFERNR